MSPLPTNIKTNTRVEQQTQTKEKERRQHQPKPSDTKECPNCHAQVGKNHIFCEHCGQKLVDYCTFCGASMGRNDTVCEECGMPAGGVNCPKCGTLNYRTFCRGCNEPLTRSALRAIEKAKQDPKVQKAAALMDKATELEQKIERLRAGKPIKEAAPATPVITEADRIVMAMLGTQAEKEEAKTTEQVETESLEQLEEEYMNVVNDINSVLSSMVPPNGSTPEEQFGFFSAQKVAIEATRKVIGYTTKRVRRGWVCNLCGCCHRYPQQCAAPELGGEWQYENIPVKTLVDQTYTTYKYE